MRTRWITGGIALLVASLASAQSITTLYATNNSGSAGGAVYFDVAVAGNSLTVTGFDVSTSAPGSFGFQVWTILGTYVGNETNQGLWTLAGTGTGTGAGLNLP